MYVGFFHACLALGEWLSLTSTLGVSHHSLHSGFLLNEHIQIATVFFLAGCGEGLKHN